MFRAFYLLFLLSIYIPQSGVSEDDVSFELAEENVALGIQIRPVLRSQTHWNVRQKDQFSAVSNSEISEAELIFELGSELEGDNQTPCMPFLPVLRPQTHWNFDQYIKHSEGCKPESNKKLPSKLIAINWNKIINKFPWFFTLAHGDSPEAMNNYADIPVITEELNLANNLLQTEINNLTKELREKYNLVLFKPLPLELDSDENFLFSKNRDNLGLKELKSMKLLLEIFKTRALLKRLQPRHEKSVVLISSKKNCTKFKKNGKPESRWSHFIAPNYDCFDKVKAITQDSPDSNRSNIFGMGSSIGAIDHLIKELNSNL